MLWEQSLCVPNLGDYSPELCHSVKRNRRIRKQDKTAGCQIARDQSEMRALRCYIAKRKKLDRPFGSQGNVWDRYGDLSWATSAEESGSRASQGKGESQRREWRERVMLPCRMDLHPRRGIHGKTGGFGQAHMASQGESPRQQQVRQASATLSVMEVSRGDYSSAAGETSEGRTASPRLTSIDEDVKSGWRVAEEDCWPSEQSASCQG